MAGYHFLETGIVQGQGIDDGSGQNNGFASFQRLAVEDPSSWPRQVNVIHLSIRNLSPVKIHAIMVLIEDGEDHAAIKDLLTFCIQDPDLLEGFPNLPFAGDGIQQGAIAEAHLKIREDLPVGNPLGLEVFRTPSIFAKALMIKGDHPVQQAGAVEQWERRMERSR